MTQDNEIANAFGGKTPAVFDPGALMASNSTIKKPGDKPFMEFKNGEYTFGSEKAECEPNVLWAVNPHSFRFGWMEWSDAKPGAEISAPPGQPCSPQDLPLKFDPNGATHSIARQLEVTLKCVEGDDEGQEVLYKTSTAGGVAALSDLITEVTKQASADKDKITPIITLQCTDYIHKKHKNKVYNPVLKVEYFDDINLSETYADAEDKPAPEPAKKEAEKPAARKRAAKEPLNLQKVASPENEPAPRRRRPRA